jgi:hypothetical protein
MKRKCARHFPSIRNYFMEESCLSNFSTSLFNLLLGRLADFAAFYGEILGKVAIAEHLDGVVGSLNQACGLEGFHIDSGSIFEASFEVRDIDYSNFVLETGVVESALGKTAMQRHLTTFKTGTHTTTGTGLLSLVATTRGLAESGAFSATKTLDAMLGSGIRFESM